MQRVLIFLIFSSFAFHSFAQQWNNAYAKNVAKVDSVVAYLQEFQDLGTKGWGSGELNDAKNWLLGKYHQMGYADVYLDTFTISGVEAYNVIAEKPGTDSNQWIIICSHYDTKNGPGVNDNGTGVVATLNIARILKKIPCTVGIRFIHFSGEEVGLYGSKLYVQNSLDRNEDLQLVFNLDQLGGSIGQNNSKITCERDENSSPPDNNALSYLKTDTLARLIDLYTQLTPVIANAYSSDYEPFQDSGYIITGLYQESNAPFTHSANDRLENLDTNATKEVIKGSVAAAMYFARHQLSMGVEPVNNQMIGVYPNPATNEVNVKNTSGISLNYRLINNLGQVIMAGNLSESTTTIRNNVNGVFTLLLLRKDNSVFSHSKLIFAN